jgi:carboxypeptidase Taq
VDAALAGGDVQPLLGWLRAQIHQQGSRYTTDDLVKKASGETLNPKHFVEYARDKYTRLYGL